MRWHGGRSAVARVGRSKMGGGGGETNLYSRYMSVPGKLTGFPIFDGKSLVPQGVCSCWGSADFSAALVRVPVELPWEGGQARISTSPPCVHVREPTEHARGQLGTEAHYHPQNGSACLAHS